MEHNISPADAAHLDGGQKDAIVPSQDAPPPEEAAGTGGTGDRSTGGGAPRTLLEHHRKMIEDESGVDPAVRAERGYFSATKKVELKRKRFSESQRDTLMPKEGKYGLLAPIHWPHVLEPSLWILRPDSPRVLREKKVKYEMPAGSRMSLDSPPRCHHMLGDPSVPLFHTEGIKKVDSGASRGGCWIGLVGVWNWRGTNEHGGKTTLPELDDVALNERKSYFVFDSDVLEKRSVYDAMVRYKDVVKKRGSDVWFVYLPPGPNGEKMGVDDWFAQDPSRTLHDLVQLASKDLIQPVAPRQTKPDRTPLAQALGDDAPVPDDLVVPLGYEVGPGGVLKIEIVGEGESMRERQTTVAPRPIFVAGIVEDAGGADHQLVLVGRYRERWVRALATREQVMDSRKLTALANPGFPIAFGRSGLISEYLDAFEAENLDKLPVARVAQQMAWTLGINEFLLGKETFEREKEGA